MKKALYIIVILFVLLPFLPKILPKPITFDRAIAAFEKAGMTVEDINKRDGGSLQAIAQVSMKVNGTDVEIYEYDNEGKIAKNLEYQKPDMGSAIVESMHLAEQLGAAKNPNKPRAVGRRGMFMILVTSEDKSLNATIVKTFKGM